MCNRFAPVTGTDIQEGDLMLEVAMGLLKAHQHRDNNKVILNILNSENGN